MYGLVQDLRHAVRRLASAPSFALIATLTLGAGIGATTAVFSVLDSILLRPLPYRESGTLYQVWSGQGGRLSRYVSPDRIRGWRDRTDLFAAVETFRNRSAALLGAGEPQFVLATEVSGGLMETLGVPALVGRVIQHGDAMPGRDAVVLLSEALWRSRFGSDPAVVGRALRVDDRTCEVVGVMPASFRFPRDGNQLWLPLIEPTSESSGPVHALVRLRPELAPQEVERQVTAAPGPLAGESRSGRMDARLELRPLAGQRVNQTERSALYVLFGAVCFVLLIACANLANLLLVEGASRERELAVRAAAGASRWRIVRQLLTETLVLAAAGGAGGLVLALWAIDLLAAYTPREFTFLSGSEVSLDARVLAFGIGLTVLTALLAGSVPALRASRVPLLNSLQSGTRTAAGSSRQGRLRQAFVVAQLALTLMLLVGAGLLARTFVALTRVDPGFEPRDLVTIDVSLPRWKYGTRAAQQQFFADAADRLRAVPGVAAVTVAGGAPPTAGGVSFGLRFEIDGVGVVLDDPLVLLPMAEVDPEYFAVLGIPLIAGRTFSPADRSGGPSAIIVSLEMAKRLWNGANPVGGRIRFDPEGTWHTVVGVVGDVYQFEYEAPRGLFAVYYPRQQSDRLTAQETLMVRTTGEPGRMMPALRQAVWSVDPDQPILQMATVEALYTRFLGVPRFQALLMGTLALIGLGIAVVGLYGVLSFAIAQRTREFGIRMALGAAQSDVRGMVLRHGAGLVFLGLAAGLAGSVLLTGATASLLVNVRPHDPATYLTVIPLLAAVSLAACWVPARRATRVDPVVALRCE